MNIIVITDYRIRLVFCLDFNLDLNLNFEMFIEEQIDIIRLNCVPLKEIYASIYIYRVFHWHLYACMHKHIYIYFWQHNNLCLCVRILICRQMCVRVSPGA